MHWLGIVKQVLTFGTANYTVCIEEILNLVLKLSIVGKWPNSCRIGPSWASVTWRLCWRNGYHRNRLGVATLRGELMSALSARSAARCRSEQMHFPVLFSRCVGSKTGPADLSAVAGRVGTREQPWPRTTVNGSSRASLATWAVLYGSSPSMNSLRQNP